MHMGSEFFAGSIWWPVTCLGCIPDSHPVTAVEGHGPAIPDSGYVSWIFSFIHKNCRVATSSRVHTATYCSGVLTHQEHTGM